MFREIGDPAVGETVDESMLIKVLDETIQDWDRKRTPVVAVDEDDGIHDDHDEEDEKPLDVYMRNEDDAVDEREIFAMLNALNATDDDEDHAEDDHNDGDTSLPAELIMTFNRYRAQSQPPVLVDNITIEMCEQKLQEISPKDGVVNADKLCLYYFMRGGVLSDEEFDGIFEKASVDKAAPSISAAELQLLCGESHSLAAFVFDERSSNFHSSVLES